MHQIFKVRPGYIHSTVMYRVKEGTAGSRLSSYSSATKLDMYLGRLQQTGTTWNQVFIFVEPKSHHPSHMKSMFPFGWKGVPHCVP